MTDTALKRFPGVTLRSDSTVYGFTLRVPKDLLHHFNGRPTIRQSLGTRDLEEANDKARLLHAELAHKFAALRRSDNPQKVELTEALVRAIANELRRWVLVADDNARDFPEFTRGLLARHARHMEEDQPGGLLAIGQVVRQSLLIPSAETRNEPLAASTGLDPLAGLSDVQHEALRASNAEALASAAMSQARRDARSILPLANEVVRSMGFTVDWTGDTGRVALLECLKVYQQATSDAARRDAGEWVDTPSAESVPTPEAAAQNYTPGDKPAHLLTLRDVFALWKAKSEVPSSKSIDTALRVVEAFELVTGNPPLQRLTWKEGLKLRDHFLAQGLAPRTTKDRIGWVSTLIRYEMSEGRRVQVDPWASIKVEKGDEAVTVRKATKAAQNSSLFALSLFQLYDLPTAKNAGRDAAYWVPVLGVYTGARITELAQLLVADMFLKDGLWRIAFRVTFPEWQSLKNKPSWREIPIHPELVRLGFLDYCKAMREAGHERLFPLVQVSDTNNAGGGLSKWFSELKSGVGWGKEHTFHSFRHGVETALKRAKEPKSHIDRYTGHAGDSVADRDYTHLEPEDLVETVQKVRPDGLELARVFPPPGWTAPAATGELLRAKSC